MAINTSLPTRLLLDSSVLPSYKVLYCILDYLSNDIGEVKYNKKKFAELLTFDSTTGPKTLPDVEIEKAVEFLSTSGYISVDKNTIFMYNNVVVRKKEPKKEKVISQDAKDIKKYHADSAVVRGYLKRARESKSDLEVIQRYLDKGYTKGDLIGYINHHFERQHIKDNPTYHTITTAFRKSIFEREYQLVDNVANIRDMVITEMGLAMPGGGDTGTWM